MVKDTINTPSSCCNCSCSFNVSKMKKAASAAENEGDDAATLQTFTSSCSCELCTCGDDCHCCDETLVSRASMVINAFEDMENDNLTLSSVVNEGVQQSQEEHVQIGIFVGGMTCSNCANSVSNAIKSSSPSEGGIVDVKINLATEYVLVTYQPHLMHKRGIYAIHPIVESIEDAGYKASLDMSTVPFYMRSKSIKHKEDESSIQIGISIGGMTCANCINSVSNAIMSSSPNEGGIEDVKINLATEYALVTFNPHLMNKQGMDVIDTILESIEDAGYEASLDTTTVPLAIRNHHTNNGMDIEMTGSIEPNTAQDRAKALKERQKRDIQNKLNAFLLSLIGSLPILIITMILGRIPAIRDGVLQILIVPGLTVEALVLWILATPVQFGSGWTFYRNSYHNIRNKMLGMDVLVAMGTSTAYFYSVGLISKGIHDGKAMHDGAHFFETSAVLISFVLLGRWLQARAVRKTSSALEKLMGLAAKTALVIIPEKEISTTSAFDPVVDKYDEKEVPVELVQKHDIIKIIRGASIPADGKILSGDLTVNESMITGEPMPVYKTVDSDLIGGTIVAEGTAFMVVRNVGKDTALSKICRMVEEAAASRAPLYADKVSSVFVPVVVAIAVVTFVTWISLCVAGIVPEEWYADSTMVTFSLLFAIAVLVISCPCALGLAPTAVMVGTGVGALQGILIKGGEQLQHASEIKAIIFDKTGTLTKGKPAISNFYRTRSVADGRDKVNDMSEADVLWMLASLERNSEHPLAAAVVSYAEQNMPEQLKEKPLVEPSNFVAVTGKGVSGNIESTSVAIGNRAYAQGMVDYDFSDEIEQELVKIESVGKTGVLAIINGVVVAVIGISDAIREDSVPSIRYLREKKNVEVWLVTGDNHRTASAVAEQLGLPKEYIIAEAAPGAKLAKVKSLQQEGKVVAMVGDVRRLPYYVGCMPISPLLLKVSKQTYPLLLFQKPHVLQMILTRRASMTLLHWHKVMWG